MTTKRFIKAIQDINSNIKKITEDDAVAKLNNIYQSKRSAIKPYILDILTEEVKAFSIPDLKVLFPLLTKVMRVFLPNDNSFNQALSSFRKPFKTAYGDGSEKYMLSLSQMFFKGSKYLKQKYKNDVAERASDRIQISVDKYKNILDKIKNNSDVLDKIIAVEMATGARSIEVIDVSDFKPSNKKNYIVQSKLAKKRGDAKINSVDKPVLYITPEHVEKLIKDIREDTKDYREGKTSTQITNNYNNRLNTRIRVLFGDDQDITNHKLRAIYGNVSYELYANKTKQTLNSWLSNTLGHNSDDLNTANSYSVIYPIMDVKREKDEDEDEENDGEIVDRLNGISDEIKEMAQELNKLEKQPRRRDGKENKMRRLLEVVEELQRNNIKITNRKLKEFGFGSTIIDEYYKSLK
jgi:hypothetical protein